MLNIKSLQRYKNTSKKTMLKNVFTSFQLGLAETLAFLSCFFPVLCLFVLFVSFFRTWTFAKPKNRFFKKPAFSSFPEKPPQPNKDIVGPFVEENLVLITH